MPSFAQSLEKTLHAALANASERSHEYATLEHLLLALIDDPDAAQVMTACGSISAISAMSCASISIRNTSR